MNRQRGAVVRRLTLFGLLAFGTEYLLWALLRDVTASWSLSDRVLLDGSLAGLVLGAAWWALFAAGGDRTRAAWSAPLMLGGVALASEFILHQAVAGWLGQGPWAGTVDAVGSAALLLLVAAWLRWLHRVERLSADPAIGGRGATIRPHRVAIAGIVGAVGVVTSLAVTGVMTQRHQVAVLEAQPELLNVAGRQRLHAYAIARLAEDARQSVDLPTVVAMLDERRVKMASEAVVIGRGLERLAPILPQADRPALRFAAVDQKRAALLAQVDAVVRQAALGASARELDGALRRLHRDADGFDPQMDDAVGALQRMGAALADELLRHELLAALMVLGLSAATLAGALPPVARILANQERRLREHGASLERLTLVARLTSNVVVITDAPGHITWVNPAFERLTGYSIDEALGWRPGALLQCPETDPATVARMRAAIAAGSAVRVQVLNRGKHGRRYWLDIDIQPLHDAQGELSGFIAVETDVTERMRVSRELSLVLEHAAAGIVVRDANGRVLDANPEAVRLLGVSAESLRAADPADAPVRLFAPDGSALPSEAHPDLQALHTGQTVSGAVVGIVTPDGTHRWLAVNAQPVSATAIDDARIVSSFVDITATREAQAALEAESRRLAAILDGTYAGTWEWNLQTDEIVVNARFAEISGLTLESMGPKVFGTWINLVHPDDVVPAARELSRHLAGETPFYAADMRVRHRERGWVWVHDRGRVARWTPGGEPAAMYGTHVDVDARVRAQLELQRAHGALRGLFELSGVGIALSDEATGRLIDCNAALLELTGYGREALQAIGCQAVGLARTQTNGHAVESVLLRQDGTRLAVLTSVTRVPQAEGGVHVWTLVQDISGRKELEQRLQRDAREDRLTGLANRSRFTEHLEDAIAHARRTGGRFAVLFLDFDRFKLVNDSLGHEAGDALLREIARRLCATLRVGEDDGGRGDVVARFGGDEFLVLLSRIGEPRDAEAVAERLLNALAPVYSVGGHEIHSSASIGIAIGGGDDAVVDADTLLRNADTAMYEAKRLGRGCAVVFDEAMHTRLARRLTVEAGLRRAIADEQFELHYQPIVDLDTGRVRSCEALLRWNHPALGMVSPGEFVPIAEDCGLIVPIGAWVLRRACRQLATWRREAPRRAPATVSVNVSRLQMNDPQSFLALVRDTLEETGLPAQCLQLEVTEREVMRDEEASRRLMLELSALGVRLAMDDFGTGTSSLGCLNEFPFDVIKLDRSFMLGVETDPDVLALVHATVTLVTNLGMTSCAEGVETPAQVATLQALGCQLGQGYLFGRPMPAARLLETVSVPVDAD